MFGWFLRWLDRRGSFRVIRLRDEHGNSYDYLRRYYVLSTPWLTIFIHRWLNSDGDRSFHDHPWNFITIGLKGGYTELQPGPLDTKKMRPGKIFFRQAERLHRVVDVLDPGNTWTLLIHFRRRRQWGEVLEPEPFPTDVIEWSPVVEREGFEKKGWLFPRVREKE